MKVTSLQISTAVLALAVADARLATTSSIERELEVSVVVLFRHAMSHKYEQYSLPITHHVTHFYFLSSSHHNIIGRLGQ